MGEYAMITKEIAQQLAEMCRNNEDETYLLGKLDKLFPEFAPFAHALCTPCEGGCGAPVRFQNFCDQCRPPAPVVPFTAFQVGATLAKMGYLEAIREQLNNQSTLYKLFTDKDYSNFSGNYYTGYTFNGKSITWDDVKGKK
jgi:hypothetical protein